MFEKRVKVKKQPSSKATAGKVSASKASALKKCFVICPIGPASSPQRRRSDQLQQYVIEPVCEMLGYEVIRADTLSDPGIITNQIIQYLVNAELVIADLTDRNPNVFYELGIRHCTGKPFIHLIENATEIPFDLAGVRATTYDLSVGSVEKCKEILTKQIQFIEDNPGKAINPVSMAVDLGDLLKGNTLEKGLGDIMLMLKQIQDQGADTYHKVDWMEFEISNIESAVSSIESSVDEIKSDL